MQNFSNDDFILEQWVDLPTSFQCETACETGRAEPINALIPTPFELYNYQRGAGNGYLGQSQSINALIARTRGCKPICEWGKHAIIDAIASIDSARKEMFAKLDMHILQIYFLCFTGWHHTSCCYNKTHFYSLNEPLVRTISTQKLQQLAQIKRQRWNGQMACSEVRYLDWPKNKEYCYKHNVQPVLRVFNHVVVSGDDKSFTVKNKYGRVLAHKDDSWRTTKFLPNINRELPANVCKFLGISPTTYGLFKPDLSKFEVLGDQVICPKGRKPRQEDYAKGLGNFFFPGEVRAGKNHFGYYQLEEWNGGWWIPAVNRMAA